MARFNAAVMDGAQDERFQNRYNYLLDLLDTAYIVEKRIDGTPIKIEMSPDVGLAFYQGGGPSGWVYRGGLELINKNLFLTANAIKGVELADRYLLWEDPPGVVGDPYLQLYDNDVRVGYINFSDTSVSLASIPIGSANSSDLILLASQYDANPENYVSLYLYGNKTSANYAQINVYSNPMTGGGNYAQYTFSPVGIVAKLNGVSNTVWHSGNDGSGSGLDADLLEGLHLYEIYSTTLYNSISSSAGITVNNNFVINTNTNSAGSTGYPTEYGQTWFFTGSSYGRDFGLYKQANIDEWSIAGVNSSRNGFGTWNKIWHSGNCASGSNANGYYIKYADGTMICYGTKDLGTFDVDTADGALYRGDASVELTWPATFYAAPNLSVSYTGSGLLLYKSGAATTTKGYFTVLSTTSLTGRTEDATYTAIGRWKA